VKRRVIDVSGLPTHAFGPRDPLWWAVALLVAIEGTMLALLAVSYFYIRSRTSPFPPVTIPRTIAWLSTIELAVWLVSALPTYAAGRAAIAGDLPRMRRQLILATALGVVAAVLRWYQFHLLPMRWDSHAYGSVVWSLLGLQWVHGLTGIGENVLYIVLLFVGPVEDKHRVDVEVSTPLWYFVIAGAALAWAVVFLEVLVS
jgi:heme/copper-type cytochrome/quinol oxidase subunit 3